MKKILLYSLFAMSFAHIQSASAETVISCGHPYSGAYVRFFPLGFPEVGHVSWGYTSITLDDCSQSTSDVLICQSHTSQAQPPAKVFNRLEIRMNGNVGVGVFRQTLTPDIYNISGKMEFKDCRRIQR